MHIIIKGGDHDRKIFGKTRAEQEENWRKEGFRSMTDEQLDKLKFAEKKICDKTGKNAGFLRGQDIDKVK